MENSQIKKQSLSKVVRLYDTTNQQFDCWGEIDKGMNFFLGHGESYQENLSGKKIETWGEDQVIQVSRRANR